MAGEHSECGEDGRRGAQEEVRSGKQGEEDTTRMAEKSTRACTGSRRGRRAEPQLVPTSSQTNASFVRRRSRAFCGARSSLHLRTDPLPVVTDNASLRSFVRSLTRPLVLPACMQMHPPALPHAGDYRGSRRTSRSPYLTRTMPCRA